MIDIAELEQYFPNPNEPIQIEAYTFTIRLEQDAKKDIFIVNLRINQKDTKEDHLIKFRLGIGKDEKTNSETHETNKPHFEIDLYKRTESSFSANAYFTFSETSEEKIMEYAKGTIVIISKIIAAFCKNTNLDKDFIKKIVYENAILKELSTFEPILIEALYDCYKKSELVVREDGEKIIIKTPHNLSKYLNQPDLQPLYLPLLKKIKEHKLN